MITIGHFSKSVNIYRYLESNRIMLLLFLRFVYFVSNYVVCYLVKNFYAFGFISFNKK